MLRRQTSTAYAMGGTSKSACAPTSGTALQETDRWAAGRAVRAGAPLEARRPAHADLRRTFGLVCCFMCFIQVFIRIDELQTTIGGQGITAYAAVDWSTPTPERRLPPVTEVSQPMWLDDRG